jgi:hypothetical protein
MLAGRGLRASSSASHACTPYRLQALGGLTVSERTSAELV